MLKWILIVFTVLASSAGDILCAKGMSEGPELQDFRPAKIGRDLGYIVTRRKVILGWMFYALSFFSLLGLLSVAKLTVAVPATALSFVIDTIGARFILHEHVPWKRWVGVICVTAGVVLAVRTNPKPPALTRPAGAGYSSVHPGQNQASHNHPGAHGFHD